MKLFADFIGVCVSLVLAYVVKFKIAQLSMFLLDYQVGVIYHHAQVEPYLQSLWIITVVVILCLIVFKGYRLTVGVMPGVDEVFKVIKGVILALMAILMINFIIGFLPESRGVFFYFGGFLMLFLSIFRLLILYYESQCYSRGLGARRSLIVGTSSLAQDIVERMQRFPIMGYRYVGFLDDMMPDTIHYHLRDTFKLLGSVENYQMVCESQKIDSLFITDRSISQALLREIVGYAQDHNIQINILFDPYFGSPFVTAGVFDGFPMMSTAIHRSFTFSSFVKRCLDVLISFLLLIVLSPLFLMIGLWIKCVSSNGPIFYLQERVAQNGRVFKMIKFRSMFANAESLSGPVMVDEENETRYIKGGRFLRQYSFDELPQLINVIKGDMSIVGPRPERPHFVQQFSKSVPFYNDRHIVPVGITGWAQVNGRSVLTRRPEHKVKYDLYYINNWSIILDFKILLKTIVVVFTKEESY